MNFATDVTKLIGNTPLVKINYLSRKNLILGKCEFLNPSHSVKDRIAYSMIKEALENGLIDKNSTVIEPTSGNTGIGLAMVCASMGLKLVLTMPSSMSMERRQLLNAFGAKLFLTDAKYGMKGAIQRAYELADDIPNSYIPGQFDNPVNPMTHQHTTAKEILKDTDGKIDIFIAGIGTGGTISGVGKILKKFNPKIKIYAVEPDLSPVLSGGMPGPHKIQGIGAGFVPKTLDTSIYDEVIKVSYEDSVSASRNTAKYEGLLVGISSGANLHASKIISEQYYDNKTIVTILCDTGERYLSSGLY